MLDYNSAKKLKEAGFPQTSDLFYCRNETWEEEKQNYVIARQSLRQLDTCWDMGELRPDSCVIPILSELIEACGDGFVILRDFGKEMGKDRWQAGWGFKIGSAKTPEEAVKNLWLKLNRAK